jgi:CRP-like cAMP-binding protein
MKWDSIDGHSPLSSFLNKIHPLSASAIEAIDSMSFPVSISKGRFLAKPGFTEFCYYLITKGVMRAFVKEDQKDITTWINEENEVILCGRVSSGGHNQEYVQALEDTECVGIPISVVEELFNKFPETNIAIRKLLEHCYRNAEESAFITRIPSAEKRYKRFTDTRPQLSMRISLKYIASYLGMTLETLSRIRGKRYLASIIAAN